jgi:hypothetical protein
MIEACADRLAALIGCAAFQIHPSKQFGVLRLDCFQPMRERVPIVVWSEVPTNRFAGIFAVVVARLQRTTPGWAGVPGLLKS